MNNTWVLATSIGLSLLFLVTALVAWLGMHRVELRPKKTSSFGSVFTAFRIFLLLYFIAVAAALFPVGYFDYAKKASVLQAFAAAPVNAFRLFFMAGDLVTACKVILGLEGLAGWLAVCYLVYLAALYFITPIFTLGFILSFFRDASSTVRYFLSLRPNVYFFSELNERSLALAEDVTRKDGGKSLIVFTDVFSRSEERVEELIASAKQLGAICMKKDVTEVGTKLKKGRKHKFYIMGDNEDENIQQALTLIHRHAGRKFDTEKLEIYVFSNTVESEALLTSVYEKEHKAYIEKEQAAKVRKYRKKHAATQRRLRKKMKVRGAYFKRIPKAMKIRRVNENFNLALHEMIEHPIFKEADGGTDPKQIGIVIVGLGGYGSELLKTICWCSQMYGYALTMHVFEKEKANGEEKIKATAPELIALNHNRQPLEAQYDIEFHYGDVGNAKFLTEIRKLKGVTKVYVSLGDDEKNIEIAMRIRAALGKVAATSGEKIPPIYPIVYSPSKTETVKPHCELRYMSKKTGIFLIGGLQTCYTLENVEQPDFEAAALDVHLRWYRDNNGNEDEGIVSFNQYEYNRKSSMARAVYMQLRERYCEKKRMEGDSEAAKENNNVLRIYEHRRWNTYMRANGYVYAPISGNDKISKLHHDLVPFDRLSEKEKTKDDY